MDIERLKQLMQKEQLTNKMLADELGYSISTVDSWTSPKKRRTPQRYTQLQIEYRYGLTPGWLDGKDVPMYLTEGPQSRNEKMKTLMVYKADYAVQTMLKFAEMKQDEWQMMKNLIEIAGESKKNSDSAK